MDNTFGKNIIPVEDHLRIDALKRYKILDTPAEHSFDNIARLATQIFKVPISLVSLVDTEKVFFKANIGMGKEQYTPRGSSICSLAILEPEVTVFENAMKEPCLLSNPNVAGEFGLQFYAGAPLTTYDGFRIGTLCIIDKIPRSFTKDEEKILLGLAAIVMDEIELRLSAITEINKQVVVTQHIEEVEERARLAIESSNIGTYDINLQNDEVITSERFNQIFSLKNGATRGDIIKAYHPDDLIIRNNGLEEAISSGNSSYQIRLLLNNGAVKWVKCNGKVFYDKENIPIRLLGTVLDITDLITLQNQKDDFLTVASHELKTPLTSIKAYIQLLDELIREGNQLTSLHVINKTERQVDRMTKMIHNFLDISKLESHKLELRTENFNINDLIIETINHYNTPEKRQRISFHTNNEKYPVINADRDKIGHVIDNFITNALKYSPVEKSILIRNEFKNNVHTISVRDHGAGINATSQAKIFQRFYRADNVKGGNATGFGIGLYFSAEIIKLHNGKVWFESIEGEGSTFYFSLPQRL